MQQNLQNVTGTAQDHYHRQDKDYVQHQDQDQNQKDQKDQKGQMDCGWDSESESESVREREREQKQKEQKEKEQKEKEEELLELNKHQWWYPTEKELHRRRQFDAHEKELQQTEKRLQLDADANWLLSTNGVEHERRRRFDADEERRLRLDAEEERRRRFDSDEERRLRLDSEKKRRQRFDADEQKQREWRVDSEDEDEPETCHEHEDEPETWHEHEAWYKGENQDHAKSQDAGKGWQDTISTPTIEKITFRNGKVYQVGQIYHQDEISKFGAGTVPMGYCWRMISKSSSNMVLEKDDGDYGDYDYSRGHGHGRDYDDYADDYGADRREDEDYDDREGYGHEYNYDHDHLYTPTADDAADDAKMRLQLQQIDTQHVQNLTFDIYAMSEKCRGTSVEPILAKWRKEIEAELTSCYSKR